MIFNFEKSEKLLTKTYSKIAIINLLIVGILGLLMRYKIAFEFPFLMQKYVQHSHSHFAFLGWVTFVLMFLIADFIHSNTISSDFKNEEGKQSSLKKYNLTIISNLILSYILFFTFIIGGYSKYSIVFSTISIFVTYYFSYITYKDLRLISRLLNNGNVKNNYTNNEKSNQFVSRNKNNQFIIIEFFQFGILFLVLSSFGTFSLAYMNAMKVFGQELYLSSVYFYLHFQYNGWFFFGVLGILLALINQVANINNIEIKFNKKIIILFSISCIPAYLLSILWAKLPDWVYIIAVITAITQMFALFLLLKDIKPIYTKINQYLSKTFKILVSLVLVSIIIKFTLQTLTTIPELSKLAYEFRPIVISYLHLVLLCIISLGLIIYFYETKLLPQNKSSLVGIYHFVVGIFINEIILTLQGIASFSYILLPYTNELLLANSLIIVTGIGIMLKSIYSKPQTKN